jgi:arylsulfatase A-like enzyme
MTVRAILPSWLAGLLLIGTTLVGCQREVSAPPARVLLVSIDTLRPDHLGTYGYARPTSPHLDAFAGQGVVFEDVTSAAPWTLPSHASLFTGMYPSHHGLASSEAKLSGSIATLATELAANGFATAAVVNSNYLSPTFGLERGFQRYRYVAEQVSQREPSRAVTEQALAWAKELAGQRWFLFVHYYDVHSDYASLPEYEAQFVRPYAGQADGTTAQLLAYRQGKVRLDAADVSHLIDLYDAGVRQMDDELARLLGGLGDDPGLMVVLVSDHGDEFLEHGGVLHGRTQYQELVRVPMLVRGPGVPSGRRVKTTVSLIDVMPTILTAVGVRVPSNVDGSDLAPTWRGGGAELGARYLSSEAAHNNPEPDTARAVRHREHTLHFDRPSGTFTLYDLTADPHEQTDIAGAHPDVVADLRGWLERLRGAGTASGDAVTLTPEQRERLRSLGYIR